MCFPSPGEANSRTWMKGATFRDGSYYWPSCWSVCNVCAVSFILSPSTVSLVSALRRWQIIINFLQARRAIWEESCKLSLRKRRRLTTWRPAWGTLPLLDDRTWHGWDWSRGMNVEGFECQTKVFLFTWSHNASVLEEAKYNLLALQGDCKDQTGRR